MRLFEASGKLLDKKAVKAFRKDWPKDKYIFIDGFLYIQRKGNKMSYRPTLEELNEDDWEVENVENQIV